MNNPTLLLTNVFDDKILKLWRGGIQRNYYITLRSLNGAVTGYFPCKDKQHAIQLFKDKTGGDIPNILRNEMPCIFRDAQCDELPCIPRDEPPCISRDELPDIQKVCTHEKYTVDK